MNKVLAIILASLWVQGCTETTLGAHYIKKAINALPDAATTDSDPSTDPVLQTYQKVQQIPRDQQTPFMAQMDATLPNGVAFDLPMGQEIALQNQASGQTILVKVTRQTHDANVVSLSLSAAKALGMHEDGVGMVFIADPPVTTAKTDHIQPQSPSPMTVQKPNPTSLKAASSPPTQQASGKFTVQVATFSNMDNAESFTKTLKQKGIGNIKLQRISIQGRPFGRIIAGPFTTESATNKAVKQLKAAGIDSPLVIKDS